MPVEIVSAGQALRRVAQQLTELLPRLQILRLIAQPGQSQGEMAQQPIFAVVQVHSGHVLDSAQAVIQPAAVKGQRRSGAFDVARVIEVGLERAHERLVPGKQFAQPVR